MNDLRSRETISAPPPMIDGHALEDLLYRHRSWATVPAGIPSVVTVFAWSLLFCDAVVTAWLIGIRRGEFECAGQMCEVATLAGHPRLTLTLAVGSLVSLLVLAFVTRAFTEGTVPAQVAFGVSAMVAMAAVIGAALLVLVGVLLIVSVLLGFAALLVR